MSEYLVRKTTKYIYCVLYDRPITFLFANIFSKSINIAIRCKKSPISWNTSIILFKSKLSKFYYNIKFINYFKDLCINDIKIIRRFLRFFITKDIIIKNYQI